MFSRSVGMALHHKLCHVLGGSFDLPHAETHTVVLPHAIAYNAARAVGPALAGIIFAAGCWAAATVAKASAVEDPGAIVIDEVAAQWLVLLPAPLDLLSYAIAFLLFRGFDIWKPWPVHWVDRHVHGGFGIMLDDLLAAVYAAVVLSILLAVGGALRV